MKPAEIGVHVAGRGRWTLNAAFRHGVWVVLADHGGACVSWMGARQHVEDGAVLILDGVRRVGLQLVDDSRAIVVQLPTPPEDVLGGPSGRLVEVSSGTSAGLLAHVVRGVATDKSNGVEYRSSRAREHIVGLVRMACLEASETEHGSPHDLFERTVDHIEARLWDLGIDADAIARSFNVSTRTLHRTFQGNDVTVSGWIRERRLQRCRRDLADPSLKHLPVGKVASTWGLPDAAHFSKLFKGRFGVSPSAFRADNVLPLQEPSTRTSAQLALAGAPAYGDERWG